ncbi:MAG: hypothetical protein HY823_08090 [Acidobacteria bacterium]|nr:hypothetical protein [Acidobacteriota bacterium]
MLKTAVVGAQTLLGRELVRALEACEASVLPLHTGPLTTAEEEGDLVIFAPEPALLEGVDLVILADRPSSGTLLRGFPGRVLDLQEDADPRESGDPMPLAGDWPPTVLRFRGRAPLEQALALVPRLVEGVGEVCATHLRSIAMLGERGIQGLLEQTEAVLGGTDPDPTKLGYRAAFEVIPGVARGALVEVRVPVFHGDILLLHLRGIPGTPLSAKNPPPGVLWRDLPPSSRDVAVSAEALAHLQVDTEGARGVLTLGYDPILWGVLRPVLRLLGLGQG